MVIQDCSLEDSLNVLLGELNSFRYSEILSGAACPYGGVGAHFLPETALIFLNPLPGE